MSAHNLTAGMSFNAGLWPPNGVILTLPFCIWSALVESRYSSARYVASPSNGILKDVAGDW